MRTRTHCQRKIAYCCCTMTSCDASPMRNAAASPLTDGTRLTPASPSTDGALVTPRHCRAGVCSPATSNGVKAPARGSVDRRIEAALLGSQTPTPRVMEAIRLVRTCRLSKLKLLSLLDKDVPADGDHLLGPLVGFDVLGGDSQQLMIKALQQVSVAIGVMAPTLASCALRFFRSLAAMLVRHIEGGATWPALSSFYSTVVARLEHGPTIAFSSLGEPQASCSPRRDPRLMDLDVALLHTCEREWLLVPSTPPSALGRTFPAGGRARSEATEGQKLGRLQLAGDRLDVDGEPTSMALLPMIPRRPKPARPAGQQTHRPPLALRSARGVEIRLLDAPRRPVMPNRRPLGLRPQRLILPPVALTG